MKIAELIPVYKNDDSNLKENYRPISVLHAVSKVFERVLKDQISPYFHEILLNILCGCRAGYSTQHALIRLLENGGMSGELRCSRDNSTTVCLMTSLLQN